MPMTTDRLGSRPGETSRNLAMIGYGLLLASIFFAGAPALVAVVIAYSQRDEAPARIRSHFDFQIRVFWIAFVLILAAAACGLTAAVSALSELINFAAVGGLNRLDSISVDLSHVSIDGRIIGLLVAAVLLGFLSSVWLLAASAVGFIRLASERGIGQSPAP